jgi:outer membrane protein assembly factor BamB
MVTRWPGGIRNSAGWLALLGLGIVGLAVAARGANSQGETGASSASVLEHHKHATRDGHYVEPVFAKATAARLHRDPRFRAPLKGPTYAQPLFWAATKSAEKDLLFVATEQDEIRALDASTGALVWRRSLGPPVPLRHLPCGNIDPLGITGTPIIDAASRTLFVDGMTTPDGGHTKTHRIAALSIDDGAMRPGWPVDVSSVPAGSLRFNAAAQNQRGALALLKGTVYVPYGGHFGDCGNYHGWVVGVPIGDPSSSRAWATRARGGGIWAPGGIASNGSALYVATGNTFGAFTWSDGEAVIRLHPGPIFGQQPDDFFVAADWRALDEADRDLGGSGPLLLQVPSAKPSQLIVALGKDGYAYLIDQARLGAIGGAVARQQVSESHIITAAAGYTTRQGTYVVFKGPGLGCPREQGGSLTAIKIAATAPPTVTVAWCAEQHGAGSPIVTTRDGRSDAIVWSVGAEGDNRVHGFDGDTGQVLFDGGGPGDGMSLVRRYQAPIVAKGRLFVAGDDEVYAFTMQ